MVRMNYVLDPSFWGAQDFKLHKPIDLLVVVERFVTSRPIVFIRVDVVHSPKLVAIDDRSLKK